MKVQIFYNNNLHHYKESDEICHIMGQCVIDKVYYSSDSFSQKMLNSTDLNEFLPCNGNYSILKIKNKQITLVVDHIRSYPLFYSLTKDSLFISDKANWIKKELKSSTMDMHAIREMKLSGYVLGDNTLYKEIKQLQAGEKIIFNLEKNFTHVETKKERFFEYFPDTSVNKSLDEYAEEHRDVISKIFSNIIKEYKGKTFVVPLSGGLDSRLIVSELKKLGYSNVICFTYGKVNNAESIVSKQIAQQLDYEWIFVEYTRDIWKEAYQSIDFQEYFYTTDNFCSLPHIQDWPCIWKLKKENKIPFDSILLPGHTGDFLATGHIPAKLQSNSTVDKFLIEIVKKHFRVNKFSNLNSSNKEYIKKHILEILPYNESNKGETIKKELFQYFDWQERQAKFIVNSVRVYDFFDFKWSIPLWNIELINFWKNIPFDLKEGKLLYKHYLVKYDDLNLFTELSKNIVIKKQAEKKDRQIISILKRFKKVLMRGKLIFKKRFLYYFNHPLQWYGMFSYFKVVFSKSRIQNINTLLVNNYINKIKNG